MNSFNLIYILTAILIFKKTICSKTEDVFGTDDAALGLILMQNETFEQENNIVDEKDIFSSFFNLMKCAREMFKKVEEEKERIVTSNKNLLNLSSILKMETLVDLKSINRDRYLAYLKESINLINKFSPLFKKKIDDESGLNMSKLIKEGILELEKITNLIPKITEVIDTEETKQKPSELDDIKEIFEHFEKQVQILKQESERYYKSAIDFFEYHRSSEVKPEKIKAHLVNFRNNSLFIKKNDIRIKAVSCNQLVSAFFRHFTTSCEIENRLLNSLCEILNDIWVCKSKAERYLKSINNVLVKN